ncbi:hypothetical protein P301_D10391 [Saccharomyces cerevisiae P301]|nr:hypothetical protein R008_D10386 [Saccharomyces cerevisiae R008]EWG91625.1 hypothetical protein P301_D10391 [Saccharomyces cerevisiae P301]
MRFFLFPYERFQLHQPLFLFFSICFLTLRMKERLLRYNLRYLYALRNVFGIFYSNQRSNQNVATLSKEPFLVFSF